MPRGRKSKYTPETVKRIVHALRLGVVHVLACQYAGISQDVFYEWIREKPEFAEAVNKAEGDMAVKMMTMIERQAPKDWHAAAWKLERRYREHYARQENQNHSGSIDGPPAGPPIIIEIGRTEGRKDDDRGDG